jgi:hypothetical protein
VIAPCQTCQSQPAAERKPAAAYQDATYGPGRRVQNPVAGKERTGKARCTVCGAVNVVGM